MLAGSTFVVPRMVLVWLVLVLFVCLVFPWFLVWLFSVSLSARDDDIGPSNGPLTNGFF